MQERLVTFGEMAARHGEIMAMQLLELLEEALRQQAIEATLRQEPEERWDYAMRALAVAS